MTDGHAEIGREKTEKNARAGSRHPKATLKTARFVVSRVNLFLVLAVCDSLLIIAVHGDQTDCLFG
jgi:hypothetical protein